MPLSFLTSLLAQSEVGENELYDIVVLEPRESIWPLIFWLAVILAILGLIFWILWYFLLSKGKNGTPLPPAARASKRLSRLEQKREVMEIGPYTQELSETLKDYLAEKFQDPVRFQTAQEFLKQASTGSSHIPEPAREELVRFLSDSEELKFGNLSEESKVAEPLARRAHEIIRICETPSPISKA